MSLRGSAAARPGAGGEHHRVGARELRGQFVDGGGLQVADHGPRTGRLDVVDVVRVADQPDDLVAALGQQPLQQQRDLPVSTRDHHAHAVTVPH